MNRSTWRFLSIWSGAALLLIASVIPYGVPSLSSSGRPLAEEVETEYEVCSETSQVSQASQRRRQTRRIYSGRPLNWSEGISYPTRSNALSRWRPCFAGHRLGNGMLAPLRC